MSSVDMNVYAFLLFGVDVSGNVRALVDHEDFLSRVRCKSRKYGAVKTGAYNKKIVHF